MKKFQFLTFALFATSLLFTACEQDDPEIPNEEEVITTLNYTLTPEGGGAEVTMRFEDLDGDGGNAPEITGGTLAANTTYRGSLELLNEQESPAEDITEEVAEEDDEHQFFFSTTLNGVTVSYDDTDGDGNPVGLSTLITTGDADSGNFTVTLRHEPDKGADGVADGKIDNAGGETDIEVTFPVEVQ
ncbi:MAG: type 1 periplasmic binding fold superfamily protein [Saprospiraceae bacterium]